GRSERRGGIAVAIRDVRERSRECARARVSAVRQRRKSTSDDRIESIVDADPRGPKRRRRSDESLAHELFARRAVERGPAGEELVRDETESVDVGARGDRTSFDTLGRDVPGRAEELLLVTIACRARDPEVGELSEDLTVDDSVSRIPGVVDSAPRNTGSDCLCCMSCEA